MNEAAEQAAKEVGVERESRFRVDLLPAFLAVAICVAVYVLLATSNGCQTSGDLARDDYYNRLVDGFRQGHLYLDKAVPEELLKAANPYDHSAIRARNWQPFSPNCLHDLSYYRGHLYLYFSAAPAVLLFLPFHALTGAYLSQPWACVVFASGGLVFIASLILSWWRHAFATVHPLVVGGGILAAGLVPLLPVLLQRSDVYEVPVSAAYFFGCAGLSCLWAMANSECWSAGRIALLSLCVGLAMACRPSEFPAATLVAIPLVVAWRRGERSVRAMGGRIVAAGLPLLAITLGLLWYNFARFGDLWQFGVKYQLNIDPGTPHHFGPGYLAFNAWHYFLHFPGWSWHFPFAGPWGSGWTMPPAMAGIEHPLGLLPSAPFVLLALVAVSRFRYWPGPPRLVVAACLWLAAANAILLCLFFGNSSRYQIAFAPYLTIVAVVGLMSLESGLSVVRARWRAIARLAWVSALVFSTAYVILFAVRLRGESLTQRGVGQVVAGDRAAALAYFAESLRWDPDDLGTLKLKAECECYLQQKPEATRDLRAIIARDPNDALSWTYLGVLAGGDRTDGMEAATCFRRAVALNPRTPGTHYNLALALMHSREHVDEAVHELRLTLRLDPQMAGARRLLIQLGQDPDAMIGPTAR